MNDGDIHSEYEKERAQFERWVGRMELFSRWTHGTKTTSGRVFIGSTLFTTITLKAMSLVRLLPGTNLHPNSETSVLDVASIATVARSLMEGCHVFYYFSVEKISEPEFHARLTLAQLHQLVERRSMLRSLGHDDGELTIGIESLRGFLEVNGYFRSLEATERRRYLEGGRPFMASLQDIGAKFTGDRDHFSMLYKFTSNYAHSHPLAFLEMSETRGRGIQSAEDMRLASLIVNACNEYVVLCCQFYQDLFPALEQWVEERLAQHLQSQKGSA